jgi:hypothetical protein
MFFDMIKVAITRLGRMLSEELRPHGVTSVSLTPGFLYSEENWRDGIAKDEWFAISETPRHIGRAVVALASDPDVSRWEGKALSSGVVAKHYGSTDVDGSQPEASRFFADALAGLRAASARRSCQARQDPRCAAHHPVPAQSFRQQRSRQTATASNADRPGAVAVGVRVKHRLHLALQLHGCHRLGDPIGHSGHAKDPDPFAPCFWYLHGLDRRREVAARGHAIPQLEQIPFHT